jgi:poly(3-hydroxyoctanoate) depolymerase
MTSGRSISIDAHLPFLSELRIAMRVQGKGDPLLLMNGMTRPMQSWDHFIGAMNGRTVVSFDAPGVGASPTSVRPLSVTELAAVAEAVLDAAGFPDADVLGYSHGGAIAQELAHQAPDRVRGLILASTSCGMGATPGAGQDILRSLGIPQVGNPWPLPDPLGLLWQSLAVSSWSSIPFLGSISVPTLVVCGSRDRVVPPSNSRVLAGRIPGASLVMLPGTGHDLQREDSSRALAHIVKGFLAAPSATQSLRTG